MSILQQSCHKVQDLRQSSALKIVSVPVSGLPGLLFYVSTGVHYPLVPEPMRRAVTPIAKFLILVNILSGDWFPEVLSGSRPPVAQRPPSPVPPMPLLPPMHTKSSYTSFGSQKFKDAGSFLLLSLFRPHSSARTPEKPQKNNQRCILFLYNLSRCLGDPCGGARLPSFTFESSNQTKYRHRV